MTTATHLALRAAAALRPLAAHRPSRALRSAALLLLAVGSLLAAAAAPPAPPAAKPADPPADKPARPEEGPAFVLIDTNKGDILLELNREKAPVTVENFLGYVDDGFYDGTIFHRVIPTFMIQGGGFDQEMKPRKTKPPIKNEWTNGLSNTRGTIAMARTRDPDSATSQFFINVKDNPALDGNVERLSPGYAVFGKVVMGMDVVDEIKDVPTQRQGAHEAVPVEPVIMEKVRRLTPEAAEKLLKEAGASR